jgi:orotate phosphoribosyltransferase
MTAAAIDTARRSLRDAVGVSRGHFAYESGHHGDLWLELDLLFADPGRVQVWSSSLAAMTQDCRAEIVCGPLVGGAFVAQFLAAALNARFVFAERLVSPATAVQYRIPDALRPVIAGKRVLLADDAVNAGSAVLSTLADCIVCGAEPACIASLIVLGDAAARIEAKTGLAFRSLLALDRKLWLAKDCPLCAAGVPLERRGAPGAG